MFWFGFGAGVLVGVIELSRRLQKPIEDVYERLVHLEANGIAVLTYIAGTQKQTMPGLNRPRYQWCMV
jgi:hypothetical protein